MNRLSKLLICLTIFATPIAGSEDLIFEEDDIKSLSSPPSPPFPGTMTRGTKWCAPCNISLSYDDLGPERGTDMCCRDHYHCADILKATFTLHGLNSNWLPVLNCTCEQSFMNCLKAVNNSISNTLGGFYYSSRRYCMVENHPIMNCKEYQSGAFPLRCVRYNMDMKKPKIWQQFDMPFYIRNA